MFLNRKSKYYKTNISIYTMYNEISIFKGDNAINITKKIISHPRWVALGISWTNVVST